MDAHVEDAYFQWLYSKVASIDVPPTPSITYYKMLQTLHSIEFVWLVVGDDNRAEEGLELREAFANSVGIVTYEDLSWSSSPCSVLEMLIALARRAGYNTEPSQRDWFWYILENLGLSELSDNKPGISQRVEEAIDTMIWRTYSFNGEGGMFPLDEPPEDQRQTEIWYQFSEYVLENDIM